MALKPAFAATPRQGIGQVSAANTNRDGSGTVVALFTGGTSGRRVERYRICATGTTTAGVVRRYLRSDGGTTKRLIRETLISALTPSTTVAVFMAEEVFAGGLQMPSNQYILYFRTHNAEAFNIFVEGGDY